MEKLLTWRDGSAVYRFHCDCLNPSHALDVTIDFDGRESFGQLLVPVPGWRRRICDALRLLMGQPLVGFDFVLRAEDRAALAALLGGQVSVLDPKPARAGEGLREG